MNTTKQGARARKRKTHDKPLTPALALAMLESAIGYCQTSGLQVRAVNRVDGALGLVIPGARYIITSDGACAAFELVTPTAPASAQSATGGAQ